MKFGSLFAGIGGFDLGFEQAGMECRWQVEIDKNCQGVLAYHWPDVKRYSDVIEIEGGDLEAVDLVSGGWPCQDLSIAGKRDGLHGDRSILFFEALRIVSDLKPRWFVFENVPGLLSSRKGQDFAIVIQALTELGYCVSWRVLDSQWFGVAQRRRRVFLVGSLGGTGSAQVLFERTSGAWDSAPSREARQGVAAAITHRIGKGGFTDPQNDGLIVDPITGRPYADNEAQHRRLVVHGFSPRQGWIGEAEELSPSINPGGGGFQAPAVAATLNSGGSGGGFRTEPGEHLVGVAKTLTRNYGKQPDNSDSSTPGNWAIGWPGVRRLTPTECERLQGFPDGWTMGCSDSARYRMLGNAVTVNVARWIGNRIMAYERGML